MSETKDDSSSNQQQKNENHLTTLKVSEILILKKKLQKKTSQKLSHRMTSIYVCYHFGKFIFLRQLKGGKEINFQKKVSP